MYRRDHRKPVWVDGQRYVATLTHSSDLLDGRRQHPGIDGSVQKSHESAVFVIGHWNGPLLEAVLLTEDAKSWFSKSADSA